MDDFTEKLFDKVYDVIYDPWFEVFQNEAKRIANESVHNPHWDLEWNDPGRDWYVWEELFANIKSEHPEFEFMDWNMLSRFTMECMRFLNIAVRSLPNLNRVKAYVDAFVSNTYRALVECSPNMLADVTDAWVQKNQAAFTIQQQWRKSVTCPDYKLCRRRLQAEFRELSTV